MVVIDEIKSLFIWEVKVSFEHISKSIPFILFRWQMIEKIMATRFVMDHTIIYVSNSLTLYVLFVEECLVSLK